MSGSSARYYRLPQLQSTGQPDFCEELRVMWERAEELSRREREVLDQIRLGLTNRQIAARLGVSTNTINKHVQEVLRKLEVDNRVQAALHGLAVAV